MLLNATLFVVDQQSKFPKKRISQKSTFVCRSDYFRLIVVASKDVSSIKFIIYVCVQCARVCAIHKIYYQNNSTLTREWTTFGFTHAAQTCAASSVSAYAFKMKWVEISQGNKFQEETTFSEKKAKCLIRDKIVLYVKLKCKSLWQWHGQFKTRNRTREEVNPSLVLWVCVFFVYYNL